MLFEHAARTEQQLQCVNITYCTILSQSCSLAITLFEEVVTAFSQSDLYLTKHLVVISLMSRVSINPQLDFMQVKALGEQ